MTSGALAGLRVLDMSTLLSAPQVAAILGDLGADVVKLEPPAGDPLRRIGAQRDGESLMWALVNRNKRAITCDLGHPEGRAAFRRLLPALDVIVENQPADLLARWECRYADLAAVNPRLVVVSVTCYGRTGPYAARPGAGTLAEAFGGLTHMTGEPDGPPVLPSLPLGDTLTALAGVVGALAACYRRDVGGGGGQHVDVSMYEPVLAMLAPALVAWSEGDPPPMRTGSRVPGGAPRNVYRAADGRWLVVSATTDAQVERVLTLLGDDLEARRARFGRSADRLERADELDGIVAAWIGTLPGADVLDALLRERIPAAPVNDLAAILADPHVGARGDIVTVDGGPAGPLRMVAPFPKLAATPGTVRSPGPALGAHNAAVYGELAGLPADELDRLAALGAV